MCGSFFMNTHRVSREDELLGWRGGALILSIRGRRGTWLVKLDAVFEDPKLLAQARQDIVLLLFDTLTGDNKNNYYRIEPKIITADNAMDNADVENLRALYADGITCVENYKKKLNELVDKLIANQ